MDAHAVFSLLLVSGAVLQNAANVLIGLGRIRRSFAAKPPRSLQKTELQWLTAVGAAEIPCSEPTYSEFFVRSVLAQILELLER